MQVKFIHTLQIIGEEMTLTVTATYYPATPGTREDPPEDESIEINSALSGVFDATKFLTDAEIEILEAAALEAVSLEYEKYHEAELEHRTNQYDFD